MKSGAFGWRDYAKENMLDLAVIIVMWPLAIHGVNCCHVVVCRASSRSYV
eukprot:COSAG01_NODE_1399_length_10465_cov_3.558267_10_plen_50_part_00